MFFLKLQCKFRNPHCLQKWVQRFKFLTPALSKCEVLLCEKAWLCSAQPGGSAFPHLHFWQQTLKHPFQNIASAMLCFTSVTPYYHFNAKNKKGNIPKLLSFPGTAQRRPCCTFSMALPHESLYRQQQINYNHGFSKSPWQDILIVAVTACAEMIGRKSAPLPHPGLLVGLVQWKTSTAALTEPSRGRRGAERDFAGCNVICGEGWGDWDEREGAGGTLLDLGSNQLTNISHALIKRDHENWSRDRNQAQGKLKRDNLINDNYQDSSIALFCCSSLSGEGMNQHLFPGLSPSCVHKNSSAS